MPETGYTGDQVSERPSRGKRGDSETGSRRLPLEAGQWEGCTPQPGGCRGWWKLEPQGPVWAEVAPRRRCNL